MDDAEPIVEKSRSSHLPPLIRWLLLAGLLAIVIAWLCSPGGPLYSYELKTLDSRFRFRADVRAPQDTVIVAIDERSVNDSRLGRWPWSRQWHAKLIRLLAAEKPRAIAFDIIFSEPSTLADDAAFASACAHARNVYLSLHASDLASRNHDALVRFAVQPQIVIGQDAMPTYGGLIPPLREFAAAAAGGGAIAASTDPDGVMRRCFFLSREIKNEGFYPTLPLAVVAGTEHWPYSGMRLNLGKDARLSPQTLIPLDQRGNALINYLGPADTVPRISYVDVLDGRFSPGTFRDKIVLVGFTAAGLLDEYPTPMHPRMAGVEVHANVIENLLHGDFLTPRTFGNMLGLTLVLALLTALAAATLRPVVGLAVLFLLLAGYDVLALEAFAKSGVVWPGLAPHLAPLLSFAGIAVFRLATEEAGRRRLRDEFGRYAPPQVVARLDSGEMRERAAGVKRDITALFADVRGFTNWSANADPHAVISVLNTYFESMTQLAFDVEGTVDNIVGDEIFVTFNAIEDQADHIHRAVDLAINMISALEGLNERWMAQGTLPEPMRIGIGINTGEALVGSLGSTIRTQYTVLGQGVNLAARLQSLNKELGTTILCTREVADAVEGTVILRNHGEHAIRGHPVPVEVFEIIGRA